MAHSQLPLLNPDRNVLLRWFLKKTFYAQFCAGENIREARRTVKTLRGLGYKGIALAYAKEVVVDEDAKREPELYDTCPSDKVCVPNEILPWKKGTLETLTMVEPGDFVALK
jgi:proline dehydrogenase